MQDNGSNNIGYHTIDGVKYRDLKPELADAINQVSAVYGGKDLLTYTAIAESTGGWNPKAGTNYMQIMKPAYDAIKDFKSHPKSKQKLQQVKDKFGIDFNTMTLDQVRNNPLANVLAARLYYMLDPNPAPTSVMATGDPKNEGIGDYWTRYYNTQADPDGTGDYFNEAINEFNYKPFVVEKTVEEKPVVKKEVKNTKKEKSIYDSVGKIGWFGLPDMGITEALFGFKKGGLRKKYQTAGMYHDMMMKSIESKTPKKNVKVLNPAELKLNQFRSERNDFDQPYFQLLKMFPDYENLPDLSGYKAIFDHDRMMNNLWDAQTQSNDFLDQILLNQAKGKEVSKELERDYKQSLDKLSQIQLDMYQHRLNQGGPQLRKHGGMYSNQGNLYSRMKQLPGGVMQQIPGSDAVEFKGQTHKQGGILMDPQTEVEDGETMDKVVMSDGTPKDYFFSSYLKKGGVSYADMHKQILAKGGSQKDINYLAMMQEKSAKRDPKMIAKLGGIAQYKKGGVKEGMPSKEEIEQFMNEKYIYYTAQGGNLKYKKWKRKNPFNLDEYLEFKRAEAEQDVPLETIGHRVDLEGAYGFRADAGDGYTVCQSGDCISGTGVMYTYFQQNEDETEGLYPSGTVIAMYEGEFEDGKPTGKGKFTWNDIEQSAIDGVPFTPWKYSSSGIYETNKTGHPELVEGTQNWEGIHTKTGIFKNGKLVSGTNVNPDGDITKIENGEETSKFSKNLRQDLVQKGLLEKIPFKYSQGEISSKYEPMLNFENYEQPSQEDLNKYGWASFDEFRADYERFVDENYNWNNVNKWGPQHQNAWNELIAGIEEGFTTTGTAQNVSTVPPVETQTLDMSQFGLLNQGPVQICPCNPDLTNYTAATSDDCFGCVNDAPLYSNQNLDQNVDSNEKANIFQRMRQNMSMKEVPPLTYLSAATQLAPAIYALTHNQPAPDLVPFESGVTSPIVPGRLRAQKLSHINMDKARSANEGAYRGMLRSIDQSGSGPAGMVQKMMAYNNMMQNELNISTQETAANKEISNQNVSIANQTNLHNQRMEQEAALGNAQMQQAEAQRLNEVHAINTAARNKIKDDQEYMKYMGVISTAQGFGNLFGDMLAYKGDRLKAQGYDIDGTTQRMLLRQHLGKPLYAPDGTVFSQQATQEDIANYYRTYYPQMNQF